MPTRQETMSNLFSCYDELEALVADLTDAEWEVQSLCPEWTVKGVVSHLAGVEHALDGWVPVEGDKKLPFNKVGEWLKASSEWSLDQYRNELAELLQRRRDQLSAMSDEVFGGWSMTPVGEGTYQRFMNVRVFDFWVHQRDMTIPLGRTTDDSGPAAELSVDEVEASIGYIVGKKIALADQMSIAFHLTGAVERDIFANVDGRAARVDSLDGPASVDVTVDSTTFVMLACGRIDPQKAIDNGDITWTGDETWGETAARNLRFTM